MISQRVLDFTILLVLNLGLTLAFASLLAAKASRQLARIPVKVRSHKANRPNRT